MARFRIGLLEFIGTITALAISLAALAQPTYLLALLVDSGLLTMVALSAAIAIGIHLRRGAFFVAFAVGVLVATYLSFNESSNAPIADLLYELASPAFSDSTGAFHSEEHYQPFLNLCRSISSLLLGLFAGLVALVTSRSAKQPPHSAERNG